MANKQRNTQRQTTPTTTHPASAANPPSTVESHGPQTLSPSASLSPELPMLAIPASASSTRMHISDVAAHLDIRISRAARLTALFWLVLPTLVAWYIVFMREQAIVGLDWFWLALMAFLVLSKLPIFFTWGVRYRIGGDGIFIKAGRICRTGPIPWSAITTVQSHNKIIRIYLRPEILSTSSTENKDSIAITSHKPILLTMYNKDTTVDQMLAKFAQYRPELF